MRGILLGFGLVLLIAGGLVYGGVIKLGGEDDVLRVGDHAVSVGDGGIKVADRGKQGRQLGIGLLIAGGVGVLAAAVMRRK